jgi:hypothetical protein
MERIEGGTTYIKVNGGWVYLCRAVDEKGLRISRTFSRKRECCERLGKTEKPFPRPELARAAQLTRSGHLRRDAEKFTCASPYAKLFRQDHGRAASLRRNHFVRIRAILPYSRPGCS